MTQHFRRARVVTMALMAAAALACVHHAPGEDDEPDKGPPVVVHVRNENFLDMNVYVLVSGVNRRLGMVTGNGAGDFSIDAGLTVGQSIAIEAVPIGGRGMASTGALSVGAGQVIEFIVAPVLRQSSVSVHDPDDR